MRRILNWVGSMAAAIVVVGISLSGEAENSVTMIRDAQGVPHIFASTDADAMYGLGYATAEDRIVQMTLNLRAIQGRLAETLGDVPLQSGVGSTLAFDRMMRTLGFYRAAERAVETLDPETLALLQAYADGVNAYLAEYDDERLALLDGVAVQPEPWKPADSIASWYQLARFFGPAGLHATLAYHQYHEGDTPREPITDEPASVIQRDDVDSEWLDQVQAFFSEYYPTPDSTEHGEPIPQMSHAWVVDGHASGTDSAALFSDPQTPVRNPSLLYEFHVQGETFNARGAGVAGSPILLVGWNAHVAWGMTALGADQADQFFLRTDLDRPDQYEVDGEWHDMEVRVETLHVQGCEPEQLEVRDTRYGPVVTALAHGVRPGEVVALKRVPQADVGHDTFEGALAMLRATDVDAFLDAVAGWRFPTANAVVGDRSGRIGYTLVGAFPLRSPHAEAGGRITQYGWDSRYDWQGFLPHDLVPRMTNPDRGHIFTANHRPIGAFYPLNLVIGTGAAGETVRSWRLRQLMEGRESITPEEVKAIHFDAVNPARKAVVTIGRHLRETGMDLSNYAIRALDGLGAWYEAGAQMRHDQPSYDLAAAIDTPIRDPNTPVVALYGGGQSGLALFFKTALDALRADPPEALPEGTTAYIDECLARAWQTHSNAEAAPDERRQRRPAAREQDTLAYFATLDGIGSLNSAHDIPVPPLVCTDGNTIWSQRAQAYSMWAPLHDIDAARSILPVSNTEYPESPHYLASLDAWAEGTLHPAPLTRQAVKAIAHETRILTR